MRASSERLLKQEGTSSGTPGPLATAAPSLAVVHDLNREMPRADDVERGLLSCLLHYPETLDDAAATLPAEAFYHAGNRLIYEEMLWYRSHKPGTPMEYLLFCQHLLDRQLMDKIGGPSVLAEISGFHPTPVHFPHFREQLLNKLLGRHFVLACGEGLQSTHTCADDFHAALAAHSEKITALENHGPEQHRSTRELVLNAVERYQAAAEHGGALPGIGTGFARVDEITGGLCQGDVWTVAGGTSDGKSAYAECIALHIAGAARKPVAYYNFEMSDEQTMDRFLTLRSQVPNQRLRRGLLNHDEQRRFSLATTYVDNIPLHLRDTSTFKLSALLADMRRMRRKHHVEVFIVDYLQLILPDHKGHTRETEVALASRSLKAAAKAMNAAIIVLAQVNDEGKLRESRSIGFDADAILLIRTPEKEGEANTVERHETRRDLMIAKCRNGARGEKIGYHFKGETFTFVEDAA